jgi:hypothetical protein
MKRIGGSGRSILPRFYSVIVTIMFSGLAACMLSCTKPPEQPRPGPSRPSDIKVVVHDGGPLILTSGTAEFRILPSGFLQGTLLKDGKRLTLDEPGEGSSGGSDSIVHDGKELDFVPDFGRAKIQESTGKLGRGKRVEIPARPLAPGGLEIERMLVAEVYDDLPNVVLVSTAYKNLGSTDFQIDQVWMQQHRFNSKLVDEKVQPYDMWAFQGSSDDW